MLNKVVLMGRLTSAPELKTTGSGISVCSFALAVDRNYVKQGAERQTDFINVVAWRQTAEFICRYFAKGQLIALDGSLQSRTYQDRDGNNRSVTEVIADNVYFTGDRRGKTSSENDSNYGASAPQEQPAQQNAANTYASGTAEDFEELLDDGDLPF
jgi:single-strand DNA-binding protein